MAHGGGHGGGGGFGGMGHGGGLSHHSFGGLGGSGFYPGFYGGYGLGYGGYGLGYGGYGYGFSPYDYGSYGVGYGGLASFPMPGFAESAGLIPQTTIAVPGLFYGVTAVPGWDGPGRSVPRQRLRRRR
jgi:hypothetical protein